MWWLCWQSPLSGECRILGCQEQILCRHLELGFERHKWAISAALLGGIVSSIAGHVLVFGLLLHKGVELRSLCQSFSDGCSVCSGLFWGERSWSVGVVATDGVCPGLGCILQSWCGRWLSCYCGLEFWLFYKTDVMGLFLFSSFFCKLISYFIFANVSVCWYPPKNNTGRLGKSADVLCELI